MSYDSDSSRPARGYFVTAAEGEPADGVAGFAHVFCGDQKEPQALCPNCREPLLQLFRFDAADERLELSGVGLDALPLLFCWTCNVAQSDFFYRLGGGGRSVSLVEYGRGGVSRDFPYENYPRRFPRARAVLEPVSEEDRKVIAAINRGDGELKRSSPELATPKHQVGGEPLLVSSPKWMRCPACRGRMPLFASVGDSAPGGLSFTGNEFTQVLFHLCRRCAVVGAYQMCD